MTRFSAFRTTYRVSSKVFGAGVEGRRAFHTFNRVAATIPCRSIVRNPFTNQFQSTEASPLFASLHMSCLHSLSVETPTNELGALADATTVTDWIHSLCEEYTFVGSVHRCMYSGEEEYCPRGVQLKNGSQSASSVQCQI